MFISCILVQNILWSFSQMKAFSDDILTLQKSPWISCGFLSLISAAPRSCDAFRLLQDSSVFLKFLQLRRVPEGLGHQDFHELPSCVIRCVIGTRGHLHTCKGPSNAVLKSPEDFFFFYVKIWKTLSKGNMFCIDDSPLPTFFLLLKCWHFKRSGVWKQSMANQYHPS